MSDLSQFSDLSQVDFSILEPHIKQLTLNQVNSNLFNQLNNLLLHQHHTFTTLIEEYKKQILNINKEKYTLYSQISEQQQEFSQQTKEIRHLQKFQNKFNNFQIDLENQINVLSQMKRTKTKN
jgi:hypothetical protein